MSRDFTDLMAKYSEDELDSVAIRMTDAEYGSTGTPAGRFWKNATAAQRHNARVVAALFLESGPEGKR